MKGSIALGGDADHFGARKRITSARGNAKFASLPPETGYARRHVGWTFVYLMLILKIPIAGLFWIVWWAVKAEPEAETEPPEDAEGGGGSKHPRTPKGPRPRRRGPHGDPRPPAPSRSRPVASPGRGVPRHKHTGA